jgi:hypothetical protein
MNMNQRLYAFVAVSSACAALAIGACGGDALPSDTQSTATSVGAMTGAGSTTTGGSSSSGGMGGSGGGGAGGAPSCISNPVTHVEIINACTTADRIEKLSILPLLGPSGELPPLP